MTTFRCEGALNQTSPTELRRLLRKVSALRTAMDRAVESGTGVYSKYVAYKSFAAAFNDMSTRYAKLTGDYNSFGVFKLDAMKGVGDTIESVQKQIFDQVYTQVLMLESQLEEYEDPEALQMSEFCDFLRNRLRAVIFEESTSEKYVQNQVESILVGRGMRKPTDFDRETGRVKYSGKEFIPDFIVPRFNAALEVKLLKRGGNVSQYIEELSADICAYLTKYENVIIVAYDVGCIRDEAEFKSGLETSGAVNCIIVKH